MQPKRSDGQRRGFFADLMANWLTEPAAHVAGPAAAQAHAASSVALAPMFDYSRSPFPRPRPAPAMASAIKFKAPVDAAGVRGSGRLRGRRALVTMAESHVGRAVAEAFAREGADVALNFRPGSQAETEELARQIRQAGRKAVLLPADLVSERACSQLVAGAVRELGGLDIVVSNATRRQTVIDIAEMSTEQFDAAFSSNIYTMFWLTKAALPHLASGSSIINTSMPCSGEAADILLDYSATKGAIMVFTKSLAKQLASRGIRVNAIAPQPIWTPLPAAGDPDAGEAGIGEAPDTDRQAELAATYVLLASTESSYATGQLYGAIGSASGN